MHVRKKKKIIMVKRGRGRGKCSGADHQATRIVSQDGLRISTKIDNINDFNIDDNLDFEPEDENNECVTDRTNFFEQSTLIFHNADKDLDNESMADTDNHSILSAHRGEMINFSRPYSQDREKCYLNVTPSVVTPRTILDSSCSESSSDSSSSSGSSVGSVSERDFSHDEKKSLDESSGPGSEDEPAELDNHPTVGATDAAFKDKKVVVTNSRNITITASFASAARAAKRKWNRAFRPQEPPVQLHLEDVGYTASQPDNWSDSAGSESAASSMSSSNTAPLPPRTTLTVTVGSGRGRTCREVGGVVGSPEGGRGKFNQAQRSPEGRSPDVQRSPSRSPRARRSFDDKPQTTTSSPKSDDLLFTRPTLSPLSSFSNQTFKMPLPPAKRPPSRPKKSDTSSLSSSCQSNISYGSSEASVSQGNAPARRAVVSVATRTTKDDDIISIVASTLGGGDNLENIDNLIFDLQNVEDIKDENDSQGESAEQEMQAGDLDRQYIENWISNIQPGAERSPFSLDVPPVQPKLSPIMGDKAPMPLLATPGSLRFDFRRVPRFFSSFCYHHYFGVGCNRANICARYHSVPTEKFNTRCKELAPNELLDHYSFVQRFHPLLKEMYSCFLEGFAFHKMESKLISTISDYLSPSLIATINPVEALRNIIKALEKMGLTFEETIEKISFNVGFLNYPILADILLEIISQKPNLAEYWEQMKRIGRACGQLPPKVVERILLKVTSVVPLDKLLCTDIYNFIVRDGRTDLSKVSNQLRQPFETFVNFGGGQRVATQIDALSEHIQTHLSREREIFERAAAVPASAPDGRHFGGAIGRSPLASSSPRSSKSSLGLRALGSDVATVEVNRYVPDTTVRRPQPVSSNTTNSLQSSVAILPDQPILGSPRYRTDFQFNVSLHNLLPDCHENIEIHERDIARLDKALRERDGKQFLVLLESYKNPVTVSNFITMTIANLLGNLGNCDDILIALLNDIVQSRPDFVEKHGNTMKGIFEVIVFNLLFEIEKRCLWREGRKLLEHFCDWDSLISSQKFRQYLMSPMGRYIFLTKLLLKSHALGYAFEILQCPNLHLLEAPEKWPLFNSPYCDMDSRNAVLDEFFSSGYRYNVVVVAALYENIFKTGKLYGYDAESKFASMMKTLINDEKLTSLKRFASDLFYSHMDKPILRAFTILMADELRLDEAFKLYEFGCQKNIYVRYTGRESRILIRTNMSNSEITLTLKHYLRQLYDTELPPSQLHIEIKLPEGPLPDTPAILQRYIRSILSINTSLRKILSDCFCITANTTDANSTVVLVAADEINSWMSRAFY